MKVDLTLSELWLAAEAGVKRQLSAIQKGRPDYYGGERGDPWGKHVEGCAAELAVAKILGRYWSGALRDVATGGDVGRLEVRSSPLADACLILRAADPDDRVFVLVTGRGPAFDVRGWTVAGDGKRPEFHRAGDHPAWFVPQRALRPVEELLGAILEGAA